MTADSPGIERIAQLQQFVADLARIERKVQLADLGRLENDVEHSYGLALTCWFLAPKIAPGLDLQRIFSYALAHDTVEAHAGDTFVFAEAAELAAKSDREAAAIKHIAADWPDFPELAEYAAGYKDKRDEEARFVYAVDKLLPALMVNLGEKSAFWNKHQITLAMMVEQKTTILQSTIVAPYYQKLVAWLSEPDYFYGAPEA